MPGESETMWEVDCGEQGVYNITETQKELILKAETHKVRFVELKDVVINIAFIRVIKKKPRNVYSNLISEPAPIPRPTKEGLKILDKMRIKRFK